MIQSIEQVHNYTTTNKSPNKTNSNMGGHFLVLLMFLITMKDVFSFNVSSSGKIGLQTSSHKDRLHFDLINARRHNQSKLQYKSDKGIVDDGNIVVTEVKRKKSSRVVSSTPIHNVLTIESLDDFTKYMDSTSDKQVTVVRFFASWCQTCRKTQPVFFRFARRNPNIIFINVPFTKTNQDLHQTLNVSAVPYGQIYISSEKVNEMNLTIQNWSQFETSVKDYHVQ